MKIFKLIKKTYYKVYNKLYDLESYGLGYNNGVIHFKKIQSGVLGIIFLFRKVPQSNGRNSATYKYTLFKIKGKDRNDCIRIFNLPSVNGTYYKKVEKIDNWIKNYNPDA